MDSSIERNKLNAPITYKDLIIDFQKSLDMEIKTIEGSRGETSLIIRHGEFIAHNSEYYIYRFATETEVMLDDDTPVDILIGKERIDGYVVSVNEAGIDVASTEDLGFSIPEARLKTSRTKLLKALMGRLGYVHEGIDGPYNERNSMILFGYLEPKKDASELSLVSVYDPPPNDEQKNSVKLALSQEVVFIWGPPGTGKTRTLSILLSELIKRKMTVLLTSHTNTAVDEILVKFVRDTGNKELVDQGKIIRYGTTSNPELKDVMIDNILDRRHAERFEEIDKIEKLNGQLKEHVDKLTALLDDEHLLKISAEQIKQKQWNCELDALGKTVSDKTKEISELNDKALQLRGNYKGAKNLGFLIRVLSGVNLEKLQKELTSTESLMYSAENVRAESEEKRRILGGILDESNDKILMLKNELPQILKDLGIDSLEKLRDTIHSTEQYVEDNNQRIDQLNREIQYDEEYVFNSAQVIGATLTKIYLDRRLYRRRFDVMILDEASMAPLPSVFFASGLAGRCVVSGDFRQLPPIAVSDDEQVTKWLKRDIFDQTGILSKIDAGSEDKRVVMLREQYRMHPRIVELINDKMYQGKLRTSDDTERQTELLASHQPCENQPIIFCDTSKVNPWCTKPNSGSKINLYSATLSVKIAEMAINSGIRNVGIITPYRLQSNMISDLIEERALEKQVIASTIHRFQGNQKECIIFDLVDGPPFSTIGVPLRGLTTSSETGRLMNVAISRAQGKIIIIANKQYLYKRLEKDSITYKILADAERTGITLNSESILSFMGLADIHRIDEKIATDDKITPLNESAFYNNFIADIRQARFRIVIYSPFITRKRMATLIDQLRLAVDRGVRVYIVTRNPTYNTNADLQDLIEELKSTGINVITPSKKLGINKDFHEKYALVDKTAFYVGSLNILSHSTSSETMLEFKSRKIIEGLSQKLNIERVIRAYDWSNCGNIQKSMYIEPDPMMIDIEKAHYKAGIIFLQLGQYDNAISELKKAIELNPSEVDYYTKISVAYSKIGKVDEEEKALRVANELTLKVK